MILAHLLKRPEAISALRAAVRILRARRIPVQVFELSSWQEVHACLQEHPAVVPIVDPYFDGALALDKITEIGRIGVSDVVLYADFSGRSIGNEVAVLVQKGMKRIVTFGVDDTSDRLADEFQAACGQGIVNEVLSDLEDRLSWQQRLAVAWAIRNGWRKCTVEEMADGLGTSSRTLRRWFEGHETLSPGTLLSWGRILAACRLISLGGTDPPTAARLLGFSSHSDLCRRYRRLTGRKLGEDVPDDPLSIARRVLAEILRETAV